MISVSTHVLDLTTGRPAAGLSVRLTRLDDRGVAHESVTIETDGQGRVGDLLAGRVGEAGDYRLHFDTGAYFAGPERATFYPYVEIVFRVGDDQHYHVPLLLSPFGYSTYRGS